MRMRRLLIEVVWPDELFPTDKSIIEYVDDGLNMGGNSRRDVYPLGSGHLVEFSDADWKRLKDTHKL